MPRLGLGLGLGNLIGRPSGGGGSVVPFSPTDLPDLELWLDANENVLSFVGNKFTDVTASATVSSVVYPSYTGEYSNTGAGGYDFANEGLKVIRKIGGLWEIGQASPDGDFNTIEISTGDVTYPWQATWPTFTVTRTATTNDIQAVNDDLVVQWNNKISAKPHLIQSTLNSRPTFKTDVFGRKAVYFNGDALSRSGFSTFGQEYSYYLVATSLLGSPNTGLHPAIRLGTSTTSTGWRGLFGADEGSLAVQNRNIKANSDGFLDRSIANDFGVFSARFNLSLGESTISRNLVSSSANSLNDLSANSSHIIIGAGDTSGSIRPINSNFSEVLVYRAHHDEATALQIINYLVQKWNINTAL